MGHALAGLRPPAARPRAKPFCEAGPRGKEAPAHRPTPDLPQRDRLGRTIANGPVHQDGRPKMNESPGRHR